MRTLAGLLLALCLLLSGCGGRGEVSTRPQADVAADADASAAEIIAAGDPVDADGADDGSRLVLYMVVSEGGEDVQTAWQLLGADGEPSAEGKGGDSVLGLGDGFWLGETIVRADGSVAEPSTDSDPLAPRPGDLAVSDFEEIRALRTDPPTVFAPLPAPKGFGQGWALDADGRQWYQRVEPEEVLVAHGAGWQDVRAVPVRPRQHLLGFGITPVGDQVVLPVVRSAKGEKVVVDAVAVRRTNAAVAEPWELLDAGPLGSAARDSFPRTFAADEQHYVFSDLWGPPYVLDVRSEQWSRLSLPTGKNGWTLEPGRDGLYAFPPSGADADGTAKDAWVSTDLGATWEQLLR